MASSSFSSNIDFEYRFNESDVRPLKIFKRGKNIISKQIINKMEAVLLDNTKGTPVSSWNNIGISTFLIMNDEILDGYMFRSGVYSVGFTVNNSNKIICVNTLAYSNHIIRC